MHFYFIKWFLTLFSFQFSSVAQSCPTLCDPMNHSTRGLPVHHQLPESTQTHVHWVEDASVVSSSVIPFSSCCQSFPASGSFQMSQLSASDGQRIRVSASTSVPPMDTQDWPPLISHFLKHHDYFSGGIISPHSPNLPIFFSDWDYNTWGLHLKFINVYSLKFHI